MNSFRPGQPGTSQPDHPQPDHPRPDHPLPGSALPARDPGRLRVLLAAILGERFHVLEAVAIGGMATVFQLRHRLSQGLFAAKVMHPDLAADPRLLHAFAREARIGARLAGHPNAVAVVDFLSPGLPLSPGSEPLHILLMPFVEGQDLDQLLARHGKLDRDEALMFLAQVCSLLMFAETEGIVHGDLALGNIRLDPFGQYRVFDYGIARDLRQDTPEDHAHLTGTPAANSPEQLRGEPLDIRSDLYSLGLLFFQALTGRPAFDSEADPHQLASDHLQGRWTLPEGILDDLPLANLLATLLQPDRQQRMPSAFQLGGALAALGFELPSAQRSLQLQALPPPRIRRRRLESM